MGPVVSAELGEYVRNVALDGLLSNGKPAGDLFVRVSARDQPEHLNLARGQGILGGMVDQFGGHVRGDALLARMDSTNGVQQLSAHVPLQYVAPRTCFQSP